MKILLCLVTVIVVIALPVFVYAQGIEWSLVNWKVRHDFPNVNRITPNELSSWLTDKKRAPPILLDVRTQAEYEVSQIPGARRIEPGANPSEIELPKDRPIVTYCSVGYRSAVFAEKLQEAGYSNVRNLSGSIFQWANEGRPLVHHGEPTDKVHPYNSVWGRLLDKAHRAN